MSFRALNIGATGLSAQSQKLDVVANNLANSNTDGFKASRASFENLVGQAMRTAGAGQTSPTGVGLSVGGGVSFSSTQTDFTQGPLRETGRPLDAAIAGDGFFAVADAQGNTLYTRAGNFSLNANGDLVLPTSSGSRLVLPGVNIPAGASDVAIGPDGTVSALLPGSQTPRALGQLQGARFINPEGLLQLGDNLLAETGVSGPPLPAAFGQDGLGVLQQGFLEGSNVEAVEEIVELINTQQAFALSAQAFQAANQNLLTVRSILGS